MREKALLGEHGSFMDEVSRKTQPVFDRTPDLDRYPFSNTTDADDAHSVAAE